ncbi:LysE family translocator [Sinimarinibacterium sp. CAU 1509]|uniref:LysE family translocator n=1 Tax=Sinimarinibacterium sp. CAU 1509 TaxID=2562283 RepID=UPI0010AC966E|nr:LysE family translocator [Sinimarinibacterium sp. CAU 1509]TJY63306.1 LysE family translocator [Sinimarinibacterium sp. CAU 1509]
MNTELSLDTTWQALALLAFSSAITPGPNNLMLLASGARFGLRRTLPHLAGVIFGTASLIALNIAGLGALMLAWPAAIPVLKVIGASYLCYLAWRLTRAAPTATTQGGVSGDARPIAFTQAASFQLVNPKVWMMGLAAATTIGSVDTARAAFGVALFMAVAMPCILLWATFGVVMLRVLRTQRAHAVFNVTICVMLIATAGLMMLA